MSMTLNVYEIFLATFTVFLKLRKKKCYKAAEALKKIPPDLFVSFYLFPFAF